MPSSTKPSQYPGVVKIFLVLASLSLFAALFSRQNRADARQVDDTHILLPMGGGYTDIFPGLINAAISTTTSNHIQILVLPFLQASHPARITDTERTDLLIAAEYRRAQIDEVCNRTAPDGKSCTTSLAPIFTRDDAFNLDAQAFFTSTLSAIFILDGDETTGMQVIGGSPIEQALFRAYDRGTIIAATGAASRLLSSALLNVAQRSPSSEEMLHFGAIDVFQNPENHGLIFGVQQCILEQQVFRQGNLVNLLNAISLPEGPSLGLGFDAYTGAWIENGDLFKDVFGLYSTVILDAGTYHAAENVQYTGPNYSISMRNVLFHLTPPGNFAYRLAERNFETFAGQTPSVIASRIQRNFGFLNLPAGSGQILLAGSLGNAQVAQIALNEFLSASGNDPRAILIIADGFPTTSEASTAVTTTKNLLGGSPLAVIVDPANPVVPMPPEKDIDGIILIGADQSLLHPQIYRDMLSKIWASGKPVLASGAATVVLGKYYSAHGPTPVQGVGLERAVQKSLLAGQTVIASGLDLIQANIENDLLADNRWGRLISLAYAHPDQLAIGINDTSLVRFSTAGAEIITNSSVITLDFSHAILGLGENDGYAVANGLLDVFGAGEMIQARPASQVASFTRASTPFIPTATITPLPTSTPTITPTPQTPTPVPTRTPRPTATPLPVPPPSDPETTHMMAFAGTFIVLVVIFGIWLNRREVF